VTVAQQNSCTATVNGTPAGSQPLSLQVLEPTIAFSKRCTIVFGNANFDVQLALSGFPGGTPVLAHGPGLFSTPLTPMPTSMRLTGTVVVTSQDARTTSWDVSAGATHGSQPLGSNPNDHEPCGSDASSIQNRSLGSSYAPALSVSCPNARVLHSGLDFVVIRTFFNITVKARGINFNPEIGFLQVGVDTRYRLERPKLEVTPASRISLTAAPLSRESAPATLTVKNAGGGLLQWSVSGVFTSNQGISGTIQSSPDRGDPTQNTGLAPGQSATVQVKALASGSAGFPATGSTTGTITVRTTNGDGTSIFSIPLTLEIAEGAGKDEVTMSDVEPSPGARLNGGEVYTIRANVKATLRTGTQAVAWLELRNENDERLVAQSAPVSTQSPEVRLEAPGFKVPTGAKEVRLQAFLEVGNQRTAESTVATFPVETPPDTVSFLASQPVEKALLEPGPLPPIYVLAQYGLYREATGELYLKAVQNGVVLALSDALTIQRGETGPRSGVTLKITGGLPIASGSGPVTLGLHLTKSGGNEQLAVSEIQYDVGEGTQLTLEFGEWQPTSVESFEAKEPQNYYLLRTLYGSEAPPTIALRLTSTGELISTNENRQTLLEWRYKDMRDNEHSANSVCAPHGVSQSNRTVVFRLVGGRCDFAGVHTEPGLKAVLFRAYAVTENGQKFYSNTVEVPFEDVGIALASPKGLTGLIAGKPMEFRIALNLSVRRPNAVLRRSIEALGAMPLVEKLQVFSPGTQPYEDLFTMEIPLDWSSFTIRYTLLREGEQDAGLAAIHYSVEHQAVLTQATGESVGFPQGKLTKVQGAVDVNVSIVKDPTVQFAADAAVAFGLGDVIKSPKGGKPAGEALRSTASGQKPQATANPDVIAIPGVWQFRPPIPRDTGFSAELTLEYKPELFPDDPAFREDKLQILAVNPETGEFTALPSTVDTAARTVTAAIQELAPMYALGVLAKPSNLQRSFTAGAVNGGENGLSLVNLERDGQSLRLTPFDKEGAAGDAATLDIAAGAQANGAEGTILPSGRRDWTHVRAGKSGVAGIQLIAGLRGMLAALPLERAGSRYSVLPWVTGGADRTTEIHIANPGVTSTELSVYLLGADGTLAAAAYRTLPAKGKAAGPLPSWFGAAAESFTGYVVVSSVNPVSVAAVHQGGRTLSASAGQGVPPQAGPTTLYGPWASHATRLHLVNLSRQPANVTLRYFGTGAGTAEPVSVELASGGQYSSNPASLFGLAANASGGIQVDSSEGLVFGEIQAVEGATRAAGIPLTRELATRAVVPLVNHASPMETTLAVASPGAPANVRVTAVASDGTLLGSATTRVGSDGVLAQALPQWVSEANGMVGYVALDSDTPIAAFALLGAADSDYAAIGAVLPPEGYAAPGTGTPAISVTPTSLDFGPVAAGQSRDLTVTVRNTGNAMLSVSAISASNARFSATPTGAFEVAAGASRDVTVRFSPTAAGAQTGTLTVASNGGSGTVSLSGSGTAASAAAIAVEPTSLDFGSVTVGQTRELPITVRNTGNAMLSMSAITASNARFSATPAGAFDLAPGATREVTVRFSPTAAGAQLGTLTVASNGGTATVSLAGTGTAAPTAVLAVDPRSLDFGSVTVGQTRELPITVRNSGNATLSINAIGRSNPLFTATPGGAFDLAPGASREVSVRFSPTAAGAQTGTLTIVSNAGSANVALIGTGAAAPAAVMLLDPTSLDFGAVAAGQTKELQITVLNIGNATLSITNPITFSNPRFAVTTRTDYTIGANSFGQIEVRFSPTAAGGQSGTMIVASNGGSAAIPLIGIGTGGSSSGATTLVTLTSAAAWPSGRTSNQVPALAIDGSTSTYTWTTESFANAAPSYLGVSVGAATAISRLRIYKDNDSGGSGPVAKNLIIEYTTSSPSTPLASRVWTAVTGLTNGFNGTELMTATAVSGNTVTGDSHVSQTSGWASLTFAPVNATGIRIGFSNAPGSGIVQNHYRVYEAQLYGQ
jgi:hypothetical protein